MAEKKIENKKPEPNSPEAYLADQIRFGREKENLAGQKDSDQQILGEFKKTPLKKIKK
ncbi:MAG: hypothetical protein GF334_02010 [Candidatus Altiarchaeales archaeon]|nr:hypothetical protein [Candidatus Altiarchaeales archaeon]